MKVSLNWLRGYVELPPTTEALVSLLTMAGIEVEGIETTGCAIANVVVAQINSSEQHPNADRLSVCQVDDGSRSTRQIVCGAKNYQVGDKVPLALPGAKLPGDFTIKVGKLRGVESQGMLCSGKELGLSSDGEGLLILPPAAKIGAPIADLYPGDTVLDLEITPNRPDLLSHTGIAREIAALTGAKLTCPPAPSIKESDAAGRPGVAVSCQAPCYYTARNIRGVKVGPSPEWLSRSLESVGLRPINNVVDVTNFVMMANGQPLHAFDAAKLRGTLRVRNAKAGEQFLALDGSNYTLEQSDLVIADDEGAVAIAGVMGGEESGVTEATNDIVLESAHFAPAAIRRTSRRLGLSTDSGYRFERGTNTLDVTLASLCAARLIADIGAAAAVGEASVATNTPALDPSNAAARSIIPLRKDRLAALLGTEVPDERIDAILTAFGLQKGDGGWQGSIRRPDLTREVDLIEEVARVLGMDVIPPRVQARFFPASASDCIYDRSMDLRRSLVAHGLHEARSITLVPERPLGLAYSQTQQENLQRVKNPMIDDQVVLRPNLLHGLLTAVRENIRAGATAVRLFEIGRVFSARNPDESQHLAIVLSGPLNESSWRESAARPADLFDLKGIITAGLGPDVNFVKGTNQSLALSLTIHSNGNPVGSAGQLWPADARGLDSHAPVIFAEIDLCAFVAPRGAAAVRKYTEIPRFPAIRRDIAMLAPLDITHAQIEAALRRADEPLLSKVELFDVFSDPTGMKVPADKRSLAYSLTYRSPHRTLTTNEVHAAHAKLKQRLTMECGVTLRE